MLQVVDDDGKLYYATRVMGTTNYKAPEEQHAQDKTFPQDVRVKCSSDLFSFAIIMAQLYWGKKFLTAFQNFEYGGETRVWGDDKAPIPWAKLPVSAMSGVRVSVCTDAVFAAAVLMELEP